MSWLAGRLPAVRVSEHTGLLGVLRPRYPNPWEGESSRSISLPDRVARCRNWLKAFGFKENYTVQNFSSVSELYLMESDNWLTKTQTDYLKILSCSWNLPPPPLSLNEVKREGGPSENPRDDHPPPPRAVTPLRRRGEWPRGKWRETSFRRSLGGGGCDARGREEPEGRTTGPTKGAPGENLPTAAQTQLYMLPRRS